ncbi:MAG: PKD domain-containing protein [Euryarchaeota archaeon]|nr:PKD domain-containing protein [Euryarchaeota archaeon]MDE1838146.1 PKD domain-containing protein [Euryarchaeota archaeon]MDE1880334.1 PKD domain-containing protein [Euryarchaeota archaeon]MDE2046353.1 PKD domain-containing protein [Thermoplasmata archaeon]
MAPLFSLLSVVVLLVSIGSGQVGSFRAAIQNDHPSARSVPALVGVPSSTLPPPSTRGASGVAYDYADGYLVLFGGAAPGGVYLSDTWIFQGGQWRQLHPATSPPARDLIEGQMVWDPVDNYVLLFGGRSSSNLTDSWSFRGGTWTEICASCGPPVQQGATVYDAADGYLLEVVGQHEYPSYSDTPAYYSYRGGTWTDLGVVPFGKRQTVGLAYDAGDGYVVAFAGNVYGGGTCFGADVLCRDTWEYHAGVWTELCTGGLAAPSCASEPSARGAPEMTFDPLDGYVVLFGGGNSTQDSDTWSFSGGAWTQRFPSATRPGDSDNALIFDASGRDRGVYSYTVNGGDDGYLWRGGAWGVPYSTYGTVTDSVTGNPVTGANVSDGGLSAVTDASGSYNLSEFNGTHVLGLVATGYPNAGATVLVAGSDVLKNFALSHTSSSLRATASANRTTGYEALAVHYTGSATGGSGAVTLSWSFGDGSSGSLYADPTHVYNASGTFVARLTATDSSGASNSSTVVIVVAPYVATSPPPTSSNGSTLFGLPLLETVALLLVIIALVAVVAILLVRRRKPPVAPPVNSYGGWADGALQSSGPTPGGYDPPAGPPTYYPPDVAPGPPPGMPPF